MSAESVQGKEEGSPYTLCWNVLEPVGFSCRKLEEKKSTKHFRVLPTARAVAPHSSTLAWEIPWTEESRRLQSMGLLKVRHD